MKTSSFNVRLALVEDHQLVSDGILRLLEGEPTIHTVGCARTGAEALALVASSKPDVLLLDLQLPDMHGLQVVEKVQCVTKVCILSMVTEHHIITQAFRNGACGYLSKDSCTTELIEAIRTTALGEPFVCSTVKKAFSVRGLFPNCTGAATLTTRETSVMELAVHGKSSKEIGRELGVSRRTAEAHRAHLMKKLELKTQTELVRYGVRNGIIQVFPKEKGRPLSRMAAR